MKEALHAKRQDGWTGWRSESFVGSGECAWDMVLHALRVLRGNNSQAVDVANYAMFIYQHECEKEGTKQ